MNQPITVRVYDIVGGPLCVSTEDGERLREKLSPLLKAARPVVVSFERVDTIISAFLNAAIGQLYGELSEDHIDRLLTIRDISDDDDEVLRYVIDNAKAYFNNPDEFDRAWREELGDEPDEE